MIDNFPTEMRSTRMTTKPNPTGIVGVDTEINVSKSLARLDFNDEVFPCTFGDLLCSESLGDGNG